MVALWGRGLISIYNDAYADLIGARAPGRPRHGPRAKPGPSSGRWSRPSSNGYGQVKTVTFVDAQQTAGPSGQGRGRLVHELVTARSATRQAPSPACWSPCWTRPNGCARRWCCAKTNRACVPPSTSPSWARGLEPIRWQRARRLSRRANHRHIPAPVRSNVAEAQRTRVHPDDLARLQAESAAGTKTGELFATAYRAIHPDGSVHHVVARGRALLDAAGTPVRIVGTNRDVTVEREAELRLRASEERFRAIGQTSATTPSSCSTPKGTSPSGRRARRR